MTEEEAVATLGVPADADRARVARAFRIIARECHPDASGGDGSRVERFRQAAEAWTLLDRRLRDGLLSQSAYVDVLSRAQRGADLVELRAEAEAVLRRLPADGISTPTRILRIHVERLRSSRSSADEMRVGREALRGRSPRRGAGLGH